MNKTTKVISAIVAVLLVAGAITMAASRAKVQPVSKAEPTKRVVKIGVIAPLSGDAGALGQEIQHVIAYQLAAINEKYKNDNLSFEPIYEDGKCSGNDSVNAFQKLTNVDGVKFIIGGMCSSETLAIAPLSEQQQVLVITPLSSSPKIEGASKFLYDFSWTDNSTAEVLAKAMSSYKKVAIITEQNDYNVTLRQVWLDNIKKNGGATVVADEMFPKGGTDVRNALEKIKKSQPDAILLNSNPGVTSQNLIKQIAEIKDWNNYQLFGHDSFMSGEILKVAPQKTEGMMIAITPKITTKDYTDLYQKMESQTGTLADISANVPSILDTVNIFTDLIKQIGDNPVAVRDILVTKSFQGYTGQDLNFRNSNYSGLGATLFVVKNGQVEALQK